MTDREQWQRERRAVVRRHHPDRGGDAATLQRLLADVDRRHRTIAKACPRRTVRDVVRTVRASIPAGWPGHRRYIDL